MHAWSWTCCCYGMPCFARDSIRRGRDRPTRRVGPEIKRGVKMAGSHHYTPSLTLPQDECMQYAIVICKGNSSLVKVLCLYTRTDGSSFPYFLFAYLPSAFIRIHTHPIVSPWDFVCTVLCAQKWENEVLVGGNRYGGETACISETNRRRRVKKLKKRGLSLGAFFAR